MLIGKFGRFVVSKQKASSKRAMPFVVFMLGNPILFHREQSSKQMR